MLVLRRRFGDPGAGYETALVVQSAVRILAVRRVGLCFETSLVPATSAPARAVQSLWVVLNGRIVARSPAGYCIARSGDALVTSEATFEGARGTRTWAFHSDGAPFEALEIRVRSNDVPEFPSIRRLGAEVLLASRRAHLALLCAAETEARVMTGELLDALACSDLARPTSSSLELVDPRLENALVDSLGRAGLGSSLKTIAGASRVSLRQTARIASELGSRLLFLPDTGFRTTALALRLRVASCLLSSPDLAVSRVAREVGYARAEALCAALRRAGMPPPDVIREMSADAHRACDRLDADGMKS